MRKLFGVLTVVITVVTGILLETEGVLFLSSNQGITLNAILLVSVIFGVIVMLVSEPGPLFYSGPSILVLIEMVLVLANINFFTVDFHLRLRAAEELLVVTIQHQLVVPVSTDHVAVRLGAQHAGVGHQKHGVARRLGAVAAGEIEPGRGA